MSTGSRCQELRSEVLTPIVSGDGWFTLEGTAIGSNSTLSVSLRAFLEAINIRITELSKAD